MSDLLGAWSLTNVDARRQLSDAAVAAMEAHLLGSLQPPLFGSGGLDERDAGRLWLVARSDKIATSPAGAVAYEGFLALGDSPVVALIGDQPARPEGHFVLAQRGRQEGRLRLLRSLSGGERLYVTRVGDLVLFASSLRPLLAHPAVERRLDVPVDRELLLTGHVLFGPQTPIEGIVEVLPGHELLIDDDVQVQRWAYSDALRSPQGAHRQLARKFHDELCTAIEKSLPRTRPVALALSGGIDSSAIAAALVEVIPAADVHAFSYEFDDPNHSVETPYAKLVTERLGIERHEVFQLSVGDYHRATLETLWRNESAVHWPKGFLLPVARHIASRGHDRYFTGFGIGSHMSYLAELPRILPWVPSKRLLARLWQKARFDGWTWLERLACLHPGLEPPHNRLYDFLLRIFEEEGYLDDRREFYPPAMAPLLQTRGSVAATAPEYAGGTFTERLQLQACAHLVSCVDVTRSEKGSREVGCVRVSPAHFARTIPYAYFPPEPPPRLWSGARSLRPGKYLLRLAYADKLPDEVIYRKKSWGDAVASHGWRRKGRVSMVRALPRFPDALKALGDDIPAAVEAWEPHSILAGCLSFWLWHRLFIEEPPRNDPPRWGDLT